MARIFTCGAFLGMTTKAGTPRQTEAQATAAPWLPLDCVTMPREASSSESEKMALVAPRILKEPVLCRFSHLKKRRAPVMASRDAEVRTGVRGMGGARRAGARGVASRVRGG